MLADDQHGVVKFARNEEQRQVILIVAYLYRNHTKSTREDWLLAHSAAYAAAAAAADAAYAADAADAAAAYAAYAADAAYAAAAAAAC